MNQYFIKCSCALSTDLVKHKAPSTRVFLDWELFGSLCTDHSSVISLTVFCFCFLPQCVS